MHLAISAYHSNSLQRVGIGYLIPIKILCQFKYVLIVLYVQYGVAM